MRRKRSVLACRCALAPGFAGLALGLRALHLLPAAAQASSPNSEPGPGAPARPTGRWPPGRGGQSWRRCRVCPPPAALRPWKAPVTHRRALPLAALPGARQPPPRQLLCGPSRPWERWLVAGGDQAPAPQPSLNSFLPQAFAHACPLPGILSPFFLTQLLPVHPEAPRSHVTSSRKPSKWGKLPSNGFQSSMYLFWMALVPTVISH